MCERDLCVHVGVYMYDFCSAVGAKLGSSGACIVINSTSGREQINGRCTVMEYTVKGEAGDGECRDREQTAKDPNIGQGRQMGGGKM